jgi:hypothetical protein
MVLPGRLDEALLFLILIIRKISIAICPDGVVVGVELVLDFEPMAVGAVDDGGEKSIVFLYFGLCLNIDGSLGLL